MGRFGLILDGLESDFGLFSSSVCIYIYDEPFEHKISRVLPRRSDASRVFVCTHLSFFTRRA